MSLPLSIPEALGEPSSATKQGVQHRHHTPFPLKRVSGAGVFVQDSALKTPNQTMLRAELSLQPGLPGRGDLLAGSRICVCCVANALPGLLLETIVSPGNYTESLETTFLLPSPAASGLTMRPEPSSHEACLRGMQADTPIQAQLGNGAIRLSALATFAALI